MSRRRITTAVTLTVLSVVLVGMAVYGFKAATAPLPSFGGGGEDECTAAEKQVQTSLSRRQVQVSVFNAGTRRGLAGTTLQRLEDAGFRGGNIGNAPEDAAVRKAEVRIASKEQSAGRLVALALGKGTRVVVTEDDLGPGVDVLVGDRFRSLDRGAPKKVPLTNPVETCVEVE